MSVHDTGAKWGQLVGNTPRFFLHNNGSNKILVVEVRAKNCSLTQSGEKRLRGDFRITTNGRAGGLLARQLIHPSSSHARRCLIWLSCYNRRSRYTGPLANKGLKVITLRACLWMADTRCIS
ncbi:hypothetical protein J6590_059790 [Homalodisca vitripennis]|nr:hypothetical protein J6590_059790 [Homalodisca vitripennis]